MRIKTSFTLRDARSPSPLQEVYDATPGGGRGPNEIKLVAISSCLAWRICNQTKIRIPNRHRLTMMNDTTAFVRTSFTKIKKITETRRRMSTWIRPQKNDEVEQAESRCLWCGLVCVCLCVVGETHSLPSIRPTVIYGETTNREAISPRNWWERQSRK